MYKDIVEIDMKTCTKCKSAKAPQEFNKKKDSKDGLQSRCKTCVSARYHNNKQLAQKYTKRQKLKRRLEYTNRIIEIKKRTSCVDCGNANPIVLQFDHVSGQKFKAITTMVHECYSWDKILEEIHKCELVCANCHQIRTFNRNGWSDRFI